MVKESENSRDQTQREQDYLEEISKLNNELINTQRALHKKNQKLKHTVTELQNALNEIKQLKELLPICAKCKKIKDDDGYWQEVESYISNHVDTMFTHGYCDECFRELYPEYADDIINEIKREKDQNQKKSS